MKFGVNEYEYVAPCQFLKGREIKEMAKIPLEDDLFLVVPGYEDELINNDTVVNLARPCVERFVVHKHHEQEIIVNGRRIKFAGSEISYAEVVEIAFPNSSTKVEIGYTVTYSHGPEKNPQGILPVGGCVAVKHNMKFDVTATHKY